MSVFVLLCRDCCCGTARKHPDLDHDAQAAALRAAAAERGGRLIRTRCLGVCEHSNVVVVKTERETHWFGGALSRAQTEAVSDFVRGREPAPRELVFRVAARRSRAGCSEPAQLEARAAAHATQLPAADRERVTAPAASRAALTAAALATGAKERP